MKVINKEQLERLEQAVETTRGTSDWHKYLMECDVKSAGRWKFIGHYIPLTNVLVEVKNYRDVAYMIEHSEDGYTRYHITDAVKELLNI